MKMILLSLILCLATLAPMRAQEICMDTAIPAEAASLLTQRLGVMCKDCPSLPLVVKATVTEKSETSGAMPQVALAIKLTLESGEVSQDFVLKGVGSSEEDAWLRAMKQFLPKSQAARDFLEKVK